MTATEIARRCGGRVEGDGDARVSSWAFDSRALDDGACFVALRDQRDGHDFVPAAFSAGARVAIVDHVPDRLPVLGAGRALVHTTDTVGALQDVARSIRAERTGLRVVAVAGSTGKTSTKELLAGALAPVGCHANAESYNNEFGLPITICNAPPAARALVTEMGERFAGDLALLCDIAQPEAGVVTNVGLAHSEHLGGPEGAAAVLGEMLSALPPTGIAVCNADDPWTERLAAHTDAAVVLVGHDGAAEYVVSDVEVDDRLRASFTLNGHRFALAMHGAHHVANAAMAVAVAHRAFGLSFDEIAAELAAATGQRWRMEFLETNDGIVILNDSYNANPTSMEAALVALGHLPVSGRRIAVLGEMRELGEHAAEAHRAAGAHAAGVGTDLLVGVGTGGAAIGDAARDAGVEVVLVATPADAVAFLEGVVTAGDAVLCKASRAVGLEFVANALLAQHRDASVPGGAR